MPITMKGGTTFEPTPPWMPSIINLQLINIMLRNEDLIYWQIISYPPPINSKGEKEDLRVRGKEERGQEEEGRRTERGDRQWEWEKEEARRDGYQG